jgi:flagellar basal-body rod protein FlgF
MNSGFYMALSGNMAAEQRLDVLTNNLANVNTAGFKRDRISFESILGGVKNPSQESGSLTDAPLIPSVRIVTDFSAGSLKPTSNTLDLALDGDGFFVVNTPQGKAYTRQGNFHLDSNGKLVNAKGLEVLASGSPVTIKGGNVVINSKGGILVDGNQVASLDIVDFPKPYQLQKEGGTQFITSVPGVEGQPARNTNVRQGFLEDSNVNTLLEMAMLMDTSRSNESCAKMIQSFDNMTSKAVNELGKL